MVHPLFLVFFFGVGVLFWFVYFAISFDDTFLMGVFWIHLFCAISDDVAPARGCQT